MAAGVSTYVNKKSGKTMYTSNITVDGEAINLGRRTTRKEAEEVYNKAKEMKSAGASPVEIWLEIVGPRNKPDE